MKTPSFEPFKVGKRYVIDVPASCSETGKRRRLYFKTLEAAKIEAREYRQKVRNDGRAVFRLSAPQAEDALTALNVLEDSGHSEVSLTSLAREYAKRYQSDKTFGQVWEEFLYSKPRSERYMRSMSRTGNLLKDLHEEPVAAITVADLEKALSQFAASYQASMTREIRAVFSWAVRRAYCVENPATRLTCTEITKRLEERPVIDPHQLEKIFEKCLEPENPKKPVEHYLIAPLAILFFAGVRPYELLRLQWRDIDLNEGMIDLPAKITKRGRRRSIPIEPNRKVWLEKAIALNGIQQGKVCKWGIKRFYMHRDNVCRRAKVLWQQNWARHSYASYWLAQHGDLNKLALHMGHTGGLEVLHRHYYRCVRQADAETYWNILPASEEERAAQAKTAA